MMKYGVLYKFKYEQTYHSSEIWLDIHKIGPASVLEYDDKHDIL